MGQEQIVASTFVLGLAILSVPLGLLLLSLALFTVKQQTVAVVQRFGKHNKLSGAGLNFKIPFVDKVVDRIDLRIQEMLVHVETKTHDNVFVKMTIAVQYQVQNPYDAYYKLTNSQGQIESYVFDVVRARVPSLKLDQVFEAKDEVADAVKGQLAHIMDDFGYHILKALVTDIDPAPQVKDSMNRINAAERLRVAAEMEAEADKIRVVKAAEANAESKHLQGIGIANQRKAIADGLAKSAHLVQGSVDNVSSESIMSLLLMTQYFDTLHSMSQSSQTRTIFMPHTPGGMTGLQEQIQQSIMLGLQSQEKS